MDEREYEQLNSAEQERIFYQSSLKDRGVLLSHSHNPDRLVRSLSHEELYLLTREVDLDERSEIIRYANMPQLFFIADVDCWVRDQIDPEAFLRWLEVLLNSDEQKLAHWLTMMDYETIIAGLRKIMVVIKPEREYAADELLGDVPYFTLDEYYFVYVREENMDTAKRVVQVLFENMRGKYAALMEGIIGEVTDELEEEAFRRRGVRLAERGFPDEESAQVIYRPVTKEEFEAFPKKDLNLTKSSVKQGLEEEQQPPSYPVLWQDDRCFLDDIFLFLKDKDVKVLENMQEEIAWLSNKVIACRGLDFTSEAKVREGVHRARILTSIGLEILSNNDIQKAAEIARERWLELVFRFAVTRLRDLKMLAHSIIQTYWKGATTTFYEFVNHPYDLIAQGALQQLPQAWDASKVDDKKAFRDFGSLEEVERIERSLNQLTSVHELLKKTFKYPFNHVVEEDKKKYLQTSLFSVLANIVASFDGKKSDVKSWNGITEERFDSFVENAFEQKGKRRSLKVDFKAAFLNAHFSEEESDELRPFWALIFSQIEDEVNDRLGGQEASEPSLIKVIDGKAKA